jgi:hypothetical protein
MAFSSGSGSRSRFTPSGGDPPCDQMPRPAPSAAHAAAGRTVPGVQRSVGLLMSDSSPAANEQEGRLQIAPADVTDFAARSEELALSLTKTPDGSGVMAVPGRPGETVIAVFMGVLQIFAPAESGIDKAAEGGGMLGLSDQRAYGLLLQGAALGGSCRVDRRGNGQVAIYSMDKSMIKEHRAREGRRGKVTSVQLVGDAHALTLDASHHLNGGRFEKATNDELLRVIRSWLP